MNLFLMQFLQFSTVYLLLLLILFIMKRCRIEKTGLLLTASAKMTIQLILSGWVLTYLFDRPNSLWTGLYLFVMMAFSIHRVLSKNPGLFPFCDWSIHDSRRVFHFSLLCHGCRKKTFF